MLQHWEEQCEGPEAGRDMLHLWKMKEGKLAETEWTRVQSESGRGDRSQVMLCSASQSQDFGIYLKNDVGATDGF